MPTVNRFSICLISREDTNQLIILQDTKALSRATASGLDDKEPKSVVMLLQLLNLFWEVNPPHRLYLYPLLHQDENRAHMIQGRCINYDSFGN